MDESPFTAKDIKLFSEFINTFDTLTSIRNDVKTIKQKHGALEGILSKSITEREIIEYLDKIPSHLRYERFRMFQ